MASHPEKEVANNSTNQDQSNLDNNELIFVERDVEVDANPDRDPLLSCFRGRKSSDSGTEGNISTKKIDAHALNKTKTKATEEKYNTKALTNLALTYMLQLFDKNLLIIFNQVKIDGYLPRLGTNEDEALLISTFHQYGFEHEIHPDYTRKQILDLLDSYSDRDFTDYGCIVVVVMTHGTYGGMIMASDIEYSEHDILTRLKARDKPTLVTKPIILLIQACRGFENTEGVAVYKASGVPKDHHEKRATIHYYLPLEADTLVFHSSYIGKPSHRPHNGSWFIQTLCKKINEMSDKTDLESIMTEVKREVACNFDSIVNNNKVVPKGDANEAQKKITAQPGRSFIVEHHKQMPTVTSTLIRKLYLIRPVNIATTAQLLTGVLPINNPSDTVDSVLVTHSQSDPCACHLNHLDYMTKCLSNYITEIKDDDYAKFLLTNLPHQRGNTELAKSYLNIMSSYLQNREILNEYHKYMYFYGPVSDGLNVSQSNREALALASNWKEIKKYMPLVIGISAFVGTLFIQNMINKLL